MKEFSNSSPQRHKERKEGKQRLRKREVEESK